MLEWVNEQKICCVSVILSSFADFHYAKKAISLGVSEYLLKPVENEELERAVIKAKKMLPVKKVQRESEKKPLRTTSEAIEKMKQYIEEHLTGEISRKELADFAGLIRISFYIV